MVLVKFGSGSAITFDQIVDEHFHERLAIMVSDKVISVSRIQNRSHNGVITITADVGEEGARDLANELKGRPSA